MNFYQRFKDEILTVGSVIVPALVAYLYAEVVDNRVRGHLIRHWPTYSLAVILAATIVYCIRLSKRLQQKDSALVKFTPANDQRYRNVLDLSGDTYYLLGMSAEEFQRNITFKEYFLDRAQHGNPVRRLRFLLLHPDSDYFSARLLEINPESNLKILIQRKKEMIRSLYLGLASLPTGLLESFEIRFFDTYPVWIMQFFKDASATQSSKSEPNGLVLSFHLSGKHAKFSQQYLLHAESSGLFDSFLNYYQRKWETSLPMGSDGSFPKKFSPERQSIKLLIFDFDGTIVESNDLKKEVFFEIYANETQENKERIEEVYRTQGGLPRSDLFKRAQRVLGDDHPSKETLSQLLDRYSENYRAKIESLRLVAGFDTFYQQFGTKYRFAIASNAPLEEVTEILKKKNIYDYFSHVSGYPTGKVEAVKTLIKTLDLEPENLLYIGDGEEDRVVCAALNVRFIVRDEPGNLISKGDHTYLFNDYNDLSRVIYGIELERLEAATTTKA